MATNKNSNGGLWLTLIIAGIVIYKCSGDEKPTARVNDGYSQPYTPDTTIKPAPAEPRNQTVYKAPVRKSKPAFSRIYYRGPRGGCYYYSASGRKVYVDRSLCD